MARFALIVLLAVCYSAFGAEVGEDEFPNYHSIGVDWGGTCESGSEQSPINVVTKNVQPISSAELKADIKTLGKIKGVKVELTDKLSTIKITWKNFTEEPEVFVPVAASDGAPFVTFNSDAEEMASSDKIMKVPIEAVQFHFHTPSEEAVDGRKYAADLHIVHTIKEGYSAKCDEEGGCLVVLGVLLDLGEDHSADSEILQPFLDRVFNKTGADGAFEMPEDFEFDLNTLLPENKDYVTWPGSLTTPPCTEGVLWLLFNDSRKISQQQVSNHQTSIAFAEGDDCEEIRDGKCFPPRQLTNSRPLQPLNDRVVKGVSF